MSLAFEAMLFARSIHEFQRRKYTGNPYTDHLAEVAGVVATVAIESTEMQAAMIATAWLHDCVADQDIRPAAIGQRFGPVVQSGVLALSDLEIGNRAERKAASRDRLAKAPGWVQTIKLADLISNTSSIVKHDPDFSVTYLAEKRALLEVMKNGDPRLYAMAVRMAGPA
jgi:(p)ppGpp synthase/HD superfamily hydrolase